MLARRFLYIVAAVIVLVIAGAFAWALFGNQLLRAALVPTVEFAASPQDDRPDYAQVTGWDAHPDIPNNPARWTPAGYKPAPKPLAAVFFITPTAYLGRDRWNMPFGDSATNTRLALYLQGQASTLNGVGAIWAPRYRQAAFGAFLADSPDARAAIDLAYSDVVRAWDAFVAANPDRPIILAAHSQGSLHLLRLMKEKLAGTPVLKRVVVAYVVGWPISVEADLPALGLPACTAAGQTGCILSWQSFAEPAEPEAIREAFDALPSLTGQPRAGTRILCSNPLLGRSDNATVLPVASAPLPVEDAPDTAVVAEAPAGDELAPPEANLGSLVPGATLADATLVAGGIGAQCLPSGVLSIGLPPAKFDNYVLPGNNYHVYDYALFWVNVRADAEARMNAWQAAQPAPRRRR
ncbi:DUF3089 domain-containing protein [Glacieibacterium frigidum]|uniref:DUF3089 domain-containing protein n=1 Tax=Glacieibacterium frigidum TaxID=2593303 RepID=A0A552U6Y2_9SPHN|nr:DUF3089 domain-containing protein [Glacieibacterium frigidum]TRW13974.1 DUF3089 domain-containing protein [Glacieibacterium frigidum]